LEITLTTVAAYGAYLLSDSMHVSGVIAVLSGGLVLGNYGRRTGMSPTTQIAVSAFWEYMAFVANSLAFLLIGLDVHVSDFLLASNYVSWGIAAMLMGRIAGVYPVLAVTNRISERVSLRWRHVLFWGGLRGSLSIALALSLPDATPGRTQLVTMIFGAVIFSLLIQGLSLGPLLARLKFSIRTPALEKSETVRAQMACAAAALERLESLRREGSVPTFTHQTLRSRFEESYNAYSSQLIDLRTADPALEELERRRLSRALVEAKKSRLIDLWRNGGISEEVFRSLQSEFDQELAGESNHQ
jgi:CPA1 family monovalent cation:H+ antiporter